METTTNGIIKATSQDIYNVEPFNKNATILDEHVSKVATETELGHIKIGAGLQMTDEVASVKLGDLIDKIYPVGSVYLSVNNISPADFIGGTWRRFGEGRTLIGVNTESSSYNGAEKTGGSETTILQEKNMPSHAHSFSWSGTPSGSASTSVSIATDGNHTHGVGTIATEEYILEGKLGNMMTESIGGLIASGVFSCEKSAVHGRYGGGTQYSDLNDISYFKGSHAHNMKGDTGLAGGHGHGASASTTLTMNNITVSGNTSTSGNKEAFSNLQPYITCYMWKRTA